MRLLSPPFYSGFPERQRIKGRSLNRLLGNMWSGRDLKGLEHQAPPCLADSRVMLETGISKWRRGRDSNPRYGVAVYTLSRRAPSTARTPLQIKMRFFRHASGPPVASGRGRSPMTAPAPLLSRIAAPHTGPRETLGGPAPAVFLQCQIVPQRLQVVHIPAFG